MNQWAVQSIKNFLNKSISDQFSLSFASTSVSSKLGLVQMLDASVITTLRELLVSQYLRGQTLLFLLTVHTNYPYAKPNSGVMVNPSKTSYLKSVVIELRSLRLDLFSPADPSYDGFLGEIGEAVDYPGEHLEGIYNYTLGVRFRLNGRPRDYAQALSSKVGFPFELDQSENYDIFADQKSLSPAYYGFRLDIIPTFDFDSGQVPVRSGVAF